MKNKLFVHFFLIITILPLLLIGGINLFIDPFNIFSHKNSLNKLQRNFNERLQKSLFLYYNSPLDYDAVLLGSSRSTYYNQNDFSKSKLYNFSFSGAQISEYKQYLDFFIKVNKKELKTIILGLDFYTYRITSEIENIKFPTESKLSFFLNNYFLLSTLEHSLTNVSRSYFNKTGHRSYNRENIVETKEISYESSEKRAISRSKDYYKDFLVDNNYKKTLLELKKSFNNSDFIIFIPPLSKPFLERIYSNRELFLIYLDWLRILTEVFENIYLFSYIDNKWSIDYKKYTIDGDHYYPNVGKEVFNQIINNKLLDGIVLNKDNFNYIIKDYLNRER